MGVVVRQKARLVAKGYSQVGGIDFNETYELIAKFTTIRTIVAIGAVMDLDIYQMDVKTTFLNRELQKDIYMDQTQGFVQQGKEHLLCKLKKSLYKDSLMYAMVATRVDLAYAVNVVSQHMSKAGPLR